MWIVSRLNAFGLVFLAGLFLGFGLGIHAIQASPQAFALVGGIGVAVGFAFGGRRPATPTPPPATASAPTPAFTKPTAIDDAISALRNLGMSNREAKTAIAGAVATLGEDADLSTLIRAGLGKGK
jgi:hypothetical protein